MSGLPTPGGNVTELLKPMTTVQPRARGQVRASFDAARGVTRLATLRQAGSSRALFPRTASKSLQMVLTNTSGGVTGGDRFLNDISMTDGAVTITTQAAERAYKAQPGQIGRIDTTLSVSGRGRLHWLPQETILFDGCNFSRRLSLEVSAGASALLVEPVVFGRSAMGEEVHSGAFSDQIDISIDKQVVFKDRTQLGGDIAAALGRRAVASGARAMAILVLVDDAVEVARDRLRPLLPETAGVSLVRDTVLVARFLATDAFELRKTLLPVIETLHGDQIPRPWMI